jgi:hypothetical protein
VDPLRSIVSVTVTGGGVVMEGVGVTMGVVVTAARATENVCEQGIVIGEVER